MSKSAQINRKYKNKEVGALSIHWKDLAITQFKDKSWDQTSFCKKMKRKLINTSKDNLNNPRKYCLSSKDPFQC